MRENAMSKLTLVAILFTLSVAGAAPAQPASVGPADVARAERLYDEGVAATDRGDFAGAISLFQASYALNPLADVLYNIGMCHKALGELPQALNAFRDYVDGMGGNLGPEEQAEFDGLLAELAPQVGRLVIDSSAGAATVSVDGAVVGTTPLPTWHAVAPGRHRVEIAKQGFELFASEVDVAAGQTLTVSAPLVALVGTPPIGPVPGPVGPVGPEPEDDEEGLSPWFWTCVGVAGASALTMAITGGLTLKYNDDFDASGRTDAGLRDTAITLRTTTDVFLGLGLAAVVAGTVLFFVLPGEESEDDEEGSVAVAPALGGLAVTW
jgi:hypothetical protein